MATETLDKEIKFLTKLKPRFPTDIEFIGMLVDMLEDDMISNDAFMHMIKLTVKCSPAPTPVPQSGRIVSGGCR